MIDIQRADLVLHRDALIRLLREYLTVRSDEKRYDWFYRNNPRGDAHVWIATDDTGEIVGSAAIVPQRVRFGHEDVAACVMADFWVHPKHRVLGPALRLQRACIDGARAAAMQLFIDLPQGAMPAVYKRLGVALTTRVVRHARPLRADAQIARLRLPPLLAGWASGAAAAALRLVDPRVRSSGGYTVAELNGPFGTEFDDLVERARDAYAMCVTRSAAYLNWRYRDHYFLEHHVVTVQRNGRLEGYAVFIVQNATAQLVDVFGVAGDGWWRPLIAGTIRLARAHGAAAVNWPLLEHDPLAAFAATLWFRPRETQPVIVHPLVDTPQQRLGRCYLAYGDIDY